MKVFARSLCSLLVGGCLLGASPAAALTDCTVTAHLDDAVTYGALQLDVTYPTPGVSFNGSDAAVACTSLTGGFVTFHDDDQGTLSAAFVNMAGTTGPTDLMSCAVTAAMPVPAIVFDVTVTDASDPNVTPIVPRPHVSLDVSCVGATTTTISLPEVSTTTTSSTVSLPDASTTTTSLGDAEVCLVELQLMDEVTLGSLQFSVDYAASGGELEGMGQGVACESAVEGAFPSFFDDDGAQRLDTAMIKLSGFTGPRPVVRCSFIPGLMLPVPEDFTVTVSDASTPNVEPVDPLPTVAVSEIVCFADTTTTTSTTTTTVPVCGDGFVQEGEVCDEGVSNSDTSPDSCRKDCTLPRCGDGVADTGEACDDGSANSDSKADACRMDCTEPVCGDGVVDSNEQCDQGADNSDGKADRCRTDCTEPTCGDGVVDADEQCDDGAANSNSKADACRMDCTEPVCGDGVVDSDEQCDDGAANSDVAADACRSDCTEPVCGDGVVDANEACDAGEANSDTIKDACRTDCTEPTCGDHVKDSGEECDNGAYNGDGSPCSAQCTISHVCGDANNDGALNVVDAQMVLQMAVGLLGECPVSLCDANGDGRVTVVDAQAVIRAAIGLGGDLICNASVTIHLDDAVTVGSLELELDYSATGGSLAGQGGDVDCTSLVDGALAAFNDVDAESKLVVGLVSITGITGPADLVSCRFEGGSRSASDLALTVKSATSIGGDPVPVPAASAEF